MRPRTYRRWLAGCTLAATLLLIWLLPGFAQALAGEAELPKPARHGPLPLESVGVGGDEQATNAAVTTGIGVWSKIVYQSYRDGNWEIYLTDGDGNLPVNLAPHPGVDARPRLNRGATHVVFDSNRDGNFEIYVVATDSSDFRRLTLGPAADYAPVWSPDSSKIAFVSNRDGNDEIYVMNADGSGQTRLTQHSAVDTGPTWSPDGSTLAWLRMDNDTTGSIWLMDADGANQRQLRGDLRYLGSLSWSPDGTNLLFDADWDQDGWNELFEISISRGQIMGVYDAFTPYVDAWAGSYSPDGRWVIFTRVEYEVVDNRLRLAHTYIEQIEFPRNHWRRMPGSGLDLNPDWVTADLVAPSSHLRQLPAYTPLGLLHLTWSGSDVGPAGLDTYDLQFRNNENEHWHDWRPAITETNTTFVADMPGETLHFRLRARDFAGNVEPWPESPTGDTTTRVFTWQVEGRVTDSRGVPLPNVPLASTPAPMSAPATDLNGRYQTWFAQSEPHTFQVGATGFGSFPASRVLLNADIEYSFYLPPPTNLIQNGGFEADLSHWVTDGATVQTGAPGAHSGDHHLMLGADCTLPCLSLPITTSWPLYQLDLAVAPDDSAHVVLAAWQDDQPLMMHSWRAVEGEWSQPAAIGRLPHSTYGNRPQLGVDNAGTLHLVTIGNERLYYSQKPAEGEWTPLAPFGALCNDPALATDPLGGVHLVCSQHPEIQYWMRSPSGDWMPSVAITNNNGYFQPGVAVGPDGTVHFVWQELNHGIFYRSRLPTGSFTEKVEIFRGDGYTFQPQRIAIGPGGEVYLFWVWQRDGYHAHRTPDGVWGAIVPLPLTNGSADVAVDGAGRLHMVGDGGYYRLREPAIGWSVLQELFVKHGNYYLAVSPRGTVHLFHDGVGKLVYRQSQLADKPTFHYAQQTLSLPAGVVHPTLAFLYKAVVGDPVGSSRLEVHVADAITSTMVFSGSATAKWTHAWANLQPWAGQEITITFALNQAADEPFVQLYLDDLAVGEWVTPVISEVIPAHIRTDWGGRVVTLKGENFASTPTIRLGHESLDVIWVDSQTVEVTLPQTAPPGIYDLWIVNPDNLQNVAPRVLALGEFLFLPVVNR